MVVLVTREMVTVYKDGMFNTNEYITLDDVKKLTSDKKLRCDILDDRNMSFMVLNIIDGVS